MKAKGYPTGKLATEKIPLLPEDVHTSFYRIAQEGLNNVVKHAQANLATVYLYADHNSLLSIKELQSEVKLVIDRG
jgi:signal transduction histidine kinase